MTEQFRNERKKELLRMRDELQETLQLETKEFHQLFHDIATKDYEEIAHEQRDHRTVGRVDLVDRERMRRIASALYRLEEGGYGICESCGAEISSERLAAMPDATLCIDCQRRVDREGR